MISINFITPNVVASIFEANKPGEFEASVALLKSQKFTWNGTAKLWEKNALLYNDDLYDALRTVTDVYFPDVIRQQIVDYPKTLPTELISESEIAAIDYTQLIKAPFGPIVGKHPYENFQDEDVRRALRQNRFLFSWEMGLGKSFATAAIYEYLRVHKGVQKMILLTSRIGTYNLRNEMDKFCLHVSKDDVQVFNSPKSFKKTTRKVFDDPETCQKSILVFSYDSWKLMVTAYGDKARGKTLNVPLDNFFGKDCDKLICLDECHYLSNPKSERSKSIFKYLRLFKYRYLFSATPADKPEKLYSICMMLDPKLVRYMKYTEWLYKYNDIGTWFSKYAINKKGWHEAELAELNDELSIYSTKRIAKEVLDLPSLTTKTFTIEMSEKQRNLYREFTNDVVNNCVKKNPDMDSAGVDIVREAFSTVMSFCENPNIIASSSTDMVSEKIKEKCGKYNYSSDYAKLEVVDAILEDEVDNPENPNRGIIWYTHPKTKDVIVDRYQKYNPIIISAEMSEEERDAALAEFKKNSKHQILIASQNILATSVTLTECTFAIYLEVLFSYMDYYQSTGRIYRIGQDRAVRLYHIWLSNSTDDFHRQALIDKQDLTKFLFSSSNRPTFELNQIRDLFLGKI